ncbi:RICIN domain-containing protein [Amycolatopsis sp. NPDC004079]|uniref:RICIN domain-containing protein n=1 Tax=Amycolatopsis sp. NPDC004079 TaxID=3154549 RepID=UPI0033B1EB1C
MRKRTRAAAIAAAVLAGSLAISAPATASQAVPHSTPCAGDGQSGKRVQAVYVHATNQPDRHDQLAEQFRTFADRIDDDFVEAGLRLGGEIRHVRFATDANCRATIDDVAIDPARMTDPQAIAGAIGEQGYRRTDRKYLVWYDKDGCGLAFGSGGDDRPGADNQYNNGPHYATVGTGCWSWQASGHELLHTLGAVNSSAPHASRNGHCWDDEDIMCYDDGGLPNPPGHLVKSCPGAPENQIDCNGDDYFNTRPPGGTYLATHWNVANNDFLIRGYRPYAVGTITGAENRCVDVAFSGRDNGTAVQLWGCDYTSAQQWTVRDGTLRSLDKCLRTSGDLAELWDCDGSAAQNWQIRGDGTILNPASGRCLGTKDGATAEGTRLALRDCTGSADQKWNTPS